MPLVAELAQSDSCLARIAALQCIKELQRRAHRTPWAGLLTQ